MSSGENRVSSSLLMAGALLVLAGYGMFFFNLDRQSVSNAEARAILTVQEMIDAQSWSIPVKGGDGRWETSPLYVWAVRLFASFNDDEVTPTVVRVPGAICGLLLALLAAWWTNLHLLRYPREDNPDLSSETMALLAGLLVATNPQVIHLARTGGADALFGLLCFAGLYCLGESFESRRSFYSGRPWTHWVLYGYALIGLATLTKGPAAMLYVVPPYAITAWVYRERKPSWVHLAGVALALLIGGWWYAFAAAGNPELREAFMNQALLERFGSEATSREPIYYYFEALLRSSFPWILLSAALVWRALFRMERTPTRLLWSVAAVCGVVWLSLVTTKKEAYLLPITPVILLLAADALAHWNYESRPGTAFRVLIRFLRWAFVVLAFAGSFAVGSDLALAFSILLAIASFWLLFHRRRTAYVYDLWERTLHGTWFLIAVFICAGIIYFRDLMPLERIYSRTEGFINLVRAHTPEDAKIYLFGRDDAPKYSYHLGKLAPIITRAEEIPEIVGPDVYLLSDNIVDRLLEHPQLAPILTRVNPSSGRPRTALFKVLDEPVRTSDTLAGKLADQPPLRIGALGNAAEQEKRIKDVVKRLTKINEDEPLHEILLLGDPYLGSTRLRRIEFKRSFLRVFGDLVEDGVGFNAVLGDQDQEIAPFVTRFPPAQMGGTKYYARSLRDGLVRFYALDSDSIKKGSDEGRKQLEWLDAELARDNSRWKIVGLFDSIMTFAEKSNADADLARDLLPILDRGKVDVVLWGEHAVYERIQSPVHHPVFFGTGWSGDADGDQFRESPELKASYSQNPGLLILEVKPSWIKFRAVDDAGKIVDEGVLFHRPSDQEIEAVVTKPPAEDADPPIKPLDTVESESGSTTPTH